MIDLALLNNNQFDVYSSAMKPISIYVNSHKSLAPKDADAKQLLTYAKQTQFITGTLIDIIDDLTYDREKFVNFIAKLDDDYDLLEEFTKSLNPMMQSHSDLIAVSNAILDDLMEAQNKLGLIVSHHENNA